MSRVRRRVPHASRHSRQSRLTVRRASCVSGGGVLASVPVERKFRAHATGACVPDAPSVAVLVARAAGSDEDAWQELVDWYAPLVWSICVRYQLSSADIEDVGQTVWLGLIGQLGKLREPAALPRWLAATTQRECVRVLKARRKTEVS